MGMVLVAFFAAWVAGVPPRHDDVHLETDQLGREGRKPLGAPSADRYSMARFWPST